MDTKLTSRQIAVLDTLAEAADELTGTEIGKRMKAQGRALLTTFPIASLMELERRQLIASRWKEGVPYPRPRLYRLTDDGRRQQRLAKPDSEPGEVFGVLRPA